MTRIKKSRKSGPLAPRKLPKEEQDRTVVDPKAKKRKGNKPGSRHSIDATKAPTSQQANKNQDKRHGSRTPIALTPVEEPKLREDLKPQVKLKKVDNAEKLTPEQELAAIESNEQLLALMERVENGEILQGKEAKFFNKQMARHAELYEILGLDEEEESDDPLSNIDKLGWEDDYQAEKDKL
ncbi:Der GTPase-activating protein YihI [Flocculibacter collagenilyticus]|uniref:Der GTPase-activating protein YihI n=1 Tax=Flocculibacter collagenilyticus TaxID=2744479 RepID=UPI0018F320C1|nr:Der GTPase-activating protein YihI [Flocculibacter collagenilyticus]